MTIVVGYTPNEFGQAALEHGIAQARTRNTDLVVINATKGDAYVEDRSASAVQMTDLDRQLSEAGVAHSVRKSMGDDIADQILDLVTEVGASLLVIGVRHRTSVGKMLMGSVSQRLILDSTVPILAVKPGQVP